MTPVSLPSKFRVSRKERDVTSKYQRFPTQHIRNVMRFRWKRGRKSGKKLLCYTCFAVFIIIVYRTVGKNGPEFERDWTCEELRAKELLTQLVSNSHKKEITEEYFKNRQSRNTNLATAY